MKIERYFIISLFTSIFLRFIFQHFALPVLSNLFIYVVFIMQLALLVLFFIQIKTLIGRVIVIYFMLYVIGIVLEFSEWRGGYPLMFIGSIGNFIFPLYMVFTRRKSGFNGLLIFLIMLGVLLYAQNIFLFFIPMGNFLSLAHTSSYFIAAVCFYLLFNEANARGLSEDERKIIVFILIAAVLSALGVTFKEKFYVH